jgi:hypothetical protein
MRKGGQSAARAQKSIETNKCDKMSAQTDAQTCAFNAQGFAGAQKENRDTDMNNDNINGSTKTTVSAPTREELQSQSRERDRDDRIKRRRKDK